MFTMSCKNVVVMALVGTAASMFAANVAEAGQRHHRGGGYHRPAPHYRHNHYRPSCGPTYRPVVYSRPVVVSRPVYYSEPVVYSAPVVYSQPYSAPVYTQPVYSQPCATPVVYSQPYRPVYYSRPAYYSSPSISFGYASGGHGHRSWGFSIGR